MAFILIKKKYLLISTLIFLILTLAGGSYAFSKGPLPWKHSQGSSQKQTSTSSTQPKITWSQEEVKIVLPQGDVAAKGVTFTSTIDLANVTIEPVPEIAGLLSVQPGAFSAVGANQPQQLNISFAIPLRTAVQTYTGTIHIRRGNQTLSRPLPVEIRVIASDWKPTINPALGINLLYPPTLFSLSDANNPVSQLIQSSSQEIVLGGALPEDSTVPYTTTGFVIVVASTVYNSPFDINQYLADIHSSSQIATFDSMLVSGIPAYRVTFRDEVGEGEPTVVIPRLGRVLEISYASTPGLDPLIDQQGLFFYNQILISAQVQ